MADQAEKPKASASLTRHSSNETRPSLTSKKQAAFADLRTDEADVKVANRKSFFVEPPPPPISPGLSSTSTVEAASPSPRRQSGSRVRLPAVPEPSAPSPRRQSFSRARSQVVPEPSASVGHRRTNARSHTISSPVPRESSSARPSLKRGLLSDMRRMYAEDRDPKASAGSKMKHVMSSVRKSAWALRWKAATIDEMQALEQDSSSDSSAISSDDGEFDEDEVAIEGLDFESTLCKLNFFSSDIDSKSELSKVANNPDNHLHEQIMAQTERLREALASLEDLCRGHLSSFDSLSGSMSDNIQDSIRAALEITKSVKVLSRELKRSNTESKMVHDLYDIATEVSGCLAHSVCNEAALSHVALAFQKCPSLKSRLSEHCSETIDKQLAESSPQPCSEHEPAVNDLLRQGATPANHCSVPHRVEAAEETVTTSCADSGAILSTSCGNSATSQLTGAPREGTWSVDDATKLVEEQLLSTSICAEGQETVAEVDSHFNGKSLSLTGNMHKFQRSSEGPIEECNGGRSGRVSSKCSGSSVESWMVLSSSEKVEANRIQSEGERKMGTPVENMCESKPGINSLTRSTGANRFQCKGDANSLECKTDAEGLERRTDVNSVECKAGANSPECETGTNHSECRSRTSSIALGPHVEKEGTEQGKCGLWRLASEEHVGPRVLVGDGDDRNESADENLLESEPTPQISGREKLCAGNRPAMMIQVPSEIYSRKELYMNEPVVVLQPFRRKHNIRPPHLDQTRVTVEAVCRHRCSKPSWCSRVAEAKTTPLKLPQMATTPTKNVTKSASVSGSSPRKCINFSTLHGNWIHVPHAPRLPPVRVLHDGSIFI